MSLHRSQRRTKKTVRQIWETKLIDDLGWEYQSMSMSDRETFDEIINLLNMIKEDEVYMEI